MFNVLNKSVQIIILFMVISNFADANICYKSPWFLRHLLVREYIVNSHLPEKDKYDCSKINEKDLETITNLDISFIPLDLSVYTDQGEMKLTKNDLKGFVNLESFSCLDCPLVAIEEDSFYHSPKLQKISLVQEYLFTYWENFSSIFPSYSKNKIPSFKFQNLTNLKKVVIRGYPINKIPANAFDNLPSLKVLDLRNNKVTQIKNNAFVGLPALQALYLGENKLKKIPYNAFKDLKELSILLLDRNKINRLKKHGFKNLNLDNLRTFDLSHNNILIIPDDSFSGLEKNIYFLHPNNNQVPSCTERDCLLVKLMDNPIIFKSIQFAHLYKTLKY